MTSLVKINCHHVTISNYIKMPSNRILLTQWYSLLSMTIAKNKYRRNPKQIQWIITIYKIYYGKWSTQIHPLSGAYNASQRHKIHFSNIQEVHTNRFYNIMQFLSSIWTQTIKHQLPTKQITHILNNHRSKRNIIKHH
jgi:hypothetical protein